MREFDFSQLKRGDYMLGNLYDYEASPVWHADHGRMALQAVMFDGAPTQCETIGQAVDAAVHNRTIDPRYLCREIIRSVDVDGHRSPFIDPVQGRAGNSLDEYELGDLVFLNRGRALRRRFAYHDPLFEAHLVPVIAPGRDPLVVQADFKQGGARVLRLSDVYNMPAHTDILAVRRGVAALENA